MGFKKAINTIKKMYYGSNFGYGKRVAEWKPPEQVKFSKAMREYYKTHKWDGKTVQLQTGEILRDGETL